MSNAFRRSIVMSTVWIVAALVLAGHLWDVAVLTSVYSGGVSMKPVTALGLIIAGLIHRIECRTDALSTSVVWGLAACMVTLTATGVTWAAIDPSTVYTINGRPSIGTVAAFVALALIAVTSPAHRIQARAGGVLVALIGLVGLLGHVVAEPTLFYHFPEVSTGMAVHTAALIALLGISAAMERE